MSDTPSQQTRTVVTERIIAHVKRGWPHLGEPVVRHRGSFCHVAARLPGHRGPGSVPIAARLAAHETTCPQPLAA